MSSVRRYMRVDVEVPFHLELIESNRFLNNHWSDLVSSKEEAQLDLWSRLIEHQFAVLFKQPTQLFKLFNEFNSKLNYLGWLVTLMVKGENPHKKADYLFRLKEQARRGCPKLKSEAKIVSLVSGAVAQLCFLIQEAQEGIAQSVDGGIYLFSHGEIPPFVPKGASSLHALAEGGVGQAALLEALFLKFNFYEKLFNRFKQQYQEVSNPELWSKQKMNLSAGGFSFYTNEVYENFTEMNVFLKLDSDILVCHGKVILVQEQSRGDFIYRVAIEFPFLDYERGQMLTLFVQRADLQAAMDQMPL